MFPERLKTLRTKKKVTQEKMADLLGITRQGYGNYENGKREPDQETLALIADFFEVSTDYLLGRSDTVNESKTPYYALSKKDERDIAKDLERMMESLEGDEALAFHGEPMDEETKRLIQISLENSMRLAKEMAKKKFTPKKYRKEED